MCTNIVCVDFIAVQYNPLSGARESSGVLKTHIYIYILSAMFLICAHAIVETIL